MGVLFFNSTETISQFINDDVFFSHVMKALILGLFI